MKRKSPTVVSLFAGCGGSSLGYKSAGFEELLAVDFDKRCAETFRMNFGGTEFIVEDLRALTGPELMKRAGIGRGDLDCLDASPPCQGFSIAGKRRVHDKRNDLFQEFARFVRSMRPKTFVMENVPGMATGKMKGRFLEISRTLGALPYRTACRAMNAANHGVPQARRRLVWIGIRNDLEKDPAFPKPGGKILTVRDAWAGREFDDLEGTNLDGIFKRLAPFWRQGETAQSALNRCEASKGRPSYFNHFRLRYDRPSRTLVAYEATRIVHPTEDRKITTCEMKLLQTLPADFKMAGNYGQRMKQIGNSVPPKMMEAIAGTLIKEVLNGAPTP